MSETIGETRAGAGRSHVPWGGIGMLALVLMVELFVSRASLDLLRPEYWLWYATGKSARESAAIHAEVLCLGTSQTSYGVVPQVLQEQLGRRVYNLAMCASPPQADYYLLKRVLDAGGRPRAVVLDLHPHLMAVPFRGSIRFFPNLLSVAECLDLSWTARDPDFAAEVLTARALPSVLGRIDLRTAILAALRGEPHSLRQPTLAQVWNRESNQGAMILPPKATPPGELTRVDYEWYAPSAWRHEPLNTLYVRRLLRLAAAHDIQVFLLIPPIDARLEQLREQRGLADAYKEFVRGLQAHHPNLVAIEGNRTRYPASVFNDAMHVTRPGAIALTTEIAGILRPHLESPSARAPRWVALPPYRDRSSAAPIVDMAESKHSALPWTVKR